MSNLTEALNRIFNWLRQNQWCHFRSAFLLQPGLSRAEIDFFIGDSNIELPQEVYELYQWRNGDRILEELDYLDLFNIYYVKLFDICHDFDGFGSWGFIPFQRVVNEYINKSNYYARMEPEVFQRFSAFPCISYFQNPVALEIFSCHYESCLRGYLYKDENYKSFPVVFTDFKGGSDTVLRLYASLTDMMMTLAESYETAYYVGKNGCLKDKNKVWEIWRKYNSEKLVLGILTKLEQLEQILPQLEMGGNLLKEIADILKCTRDQRLIAPLIRVLRRPPTNTQIDENLDYFRQMCSLYLGWLGGVEAVEPLIDALKDEYWLTRYWAAITLGEITDLRAVSPLYELLQDSHEMVRHAANEALSQITNPNAVNDPIYSNPAIANLEASAALYGMTLSDMLNPNIETLQEQSNNYTTMDEDQDLSFADDNPDNIPF